MKNENYARGFGHWFYLLLLLSFCSLLFYYTITIRRPWFGTLSEDGHQWLSGGELKYCKNWYRDGPWSLRFAMCENPPSIEFPTLADRLPYVSYPPGSVIPLYLVSVLLGHEPTPVTLMSFNLANHFMIALLLGGLIYWFLVKNHYPRGRAFGFAIIPVNLELLLPAPLYWHQNVFFSDQAVILPAVLFLFLEVTNESLRLPPIKRFIVIIQIVTMVLGTLTDWFFIFVLGGVYFRRVLMGKMGTTRSLFLIRSFTFWFPAGVALTLFAVQLWILNGFSDLFRQFMLRTTINDQGKCYTSSFYSRFWLGHVGAGYGKLAIGLLWGSLLLLSISLVIIAFRGRRKQPHDPFQNHLTSLIALLLLPCMVQIYFLKNHSWDHSFSALKLSVPLATIPFVLAPLLIYQGICSRLSSQKDRLIAGEAFSWFLMIGMLLSSSLYLMSVHPQSTNLFPEPHLYLERIGTFIAQNTKYEDVVFSPDLEIAIEPPQFLSYSMKRVYKIQTIDKMRRLTEDLPGNATITIFLNQEPLPPDSFLFQLLSSQDPTVRRGNLTLYRLPRLDSHAYWEKVFSAHNQ